MRHKYGAPRNSLDINKNNDMISTETVRLPTQNGLAKYKNYYSSFMRLMSKVAEPFLPAVFIVQQLFRNGSIHRERINQYHESRFGKSAKAYREKSNTVAFYLHFRSGHILCRSLSRWNSIDQTSVKFIHCTYGTCAL
mmetsp:Transcript_27305/g.74690  ORF Transcript_27305/g.74690 Transcript_27305/m.74690 type:complete len:138 (+) Transcript_27305:444-857(+)